MKRSLYMMAIMAIGVLVCLSSAPADEDDTIAESGRPDSAAAEESSQSTSPGDVELTAKLSKDELAEDREARKKLVEKMMQAYREVRQLKEEGKTQEAEKRMAELKELRQQIARQAGQHHRHGGPHADPEAARRHRELREKIQQAKESGDEEKVRELIQQARTSARHFHQHPRGDRDRTRPGQADRDRRGPRRMDAIPLTAAGRRATGSGSQAPPGSAEQRLRHIRMAAANLDAAGMREMANRVREEGRKVSEQIRRRHEQGGQRAMQDIQRHLRELTEEVHRLRRQVEELSQE